MSKRTLFVLGLILLLSSFLRLYKWEDTLRMGSDQAMAFLLANRIIHHGHILLTGPIVSFGEINILPPTYYYIITALFFLLRSDILVTAVFSFVSLSLPILGFLVGRTLLGTKGGLLFSLLLAASKDLMLYGRFIWEPHLLPFLFLLWLYLLIQSEKRKSVALFAISYLIFFLFFHYAASFLLLPTFFILSAHVGKRITQRKYAHIISAGFTAFTLLLAYIPVLIFEIKNAYPSWVHIQNYFHGKTPLFQYTLEQFRLSFVTHLQLFAASVFPSPMKINSPLMSSENILIVLLFLLLPLFVSKRFGYTMRILCLNFLLIFLLFSAYHGQAFVHRFASIYPVFFLLLAATPQLFPQKSILATMGKSISIISLVLAVTLNSIVSMRSIWINSSSNYRNQDEVARYILASSQSQTFSLFTITPDNTTGYYNAEYYYALEKMSGKPLIGLNGYGNWIYPALSTNVSRIYLICKRYDRYNDTPQKIGERCLKSFQRSQQLSPPVQEKTFDSAIVFTFIPSEQEQ